VRPGELDGTAHLSYSVRGTLLDSEAKGCKVQTAIVKLLEWDVRVNGHYFGRPDGSTQVVLTADPIEGPSYLETFEDCPIPDRRQPGVKWSAVSGRLVNGVYDLRQDMPLPRNTTGESYFVVHMESPQKTPPAAPAPTTTAGSQSDFTLSLAPPSNTMKAGGKATYTILIRRVNFQGGVTLSVKQLPAGVTATIEPNPGFGASSLLTLDVAPSTSRGSHGFMVVGISGPRVRSTTGTLVVQ
jgi:hypothetical protein